MKVKLKGLLILQKIKYLNYKDEINEKERNLEINTYYEKNIKTI